MAQNRQTTLSPEELSQLLEAMLFQGVRASPSVPVNLLPPNPGTHNTQKTPGHNTVNPWAMTPATNEPMNQNPQPPTKEQKTDKNPIGSQKSPTPLIDELWERAQTIEPLFNSHCSIRVDAGFFSSTNNEIKTHECILDTGAQMNVMTLGMAKKLGLEDHIDTRAIREVRGVGGSGKNVGMIPFLEFTLGPTLVSSNFTILDNIEKDNFILLGMPFMFHYEMIFDFKRGKLVVSGYDVNMKICE